MASLPPEVNFAQRLAGNTKKIRDQALKKLRKYMKSKSASKKGGFSKEDFLKLWKGLHYCLWMQDKAIVQEELNVTLAKLVHELATVEAQLLFVQVFFITEAREWNSIDVWRLDKFMALVRYMLNESFVVIKKHNWSRDNLQQLVSVFSEEIMSPVNDTIPDGLRIHFADIYLDEVEKVGGNQLSGDQLVLLLEPFVNFVRTAKNTVVVKRVISRVFDPIITRAVALLKKSAEMTEEQEEVPYHSLKFDCGLLAEHLFEVSKQPDMLSRNRPLLYRLVQRLQDVSKGVIPQKKESVADPGLTEKDIDEAVRQLANFERQKKKKKKKKSNTDNQESETESDTDGKENDISDQNNNSDNPSVYIAPESPGDKTPVAGKRKLSAGSTNAQEEVPVKKMKKKEEGSDKISFKKIKEKLMKSRKDSSRKDSDITLTPISNKPVKDKTPVRVKQNSSGWSVTPMKSDTEESAKKESPVKNITSIKVGKITTKTPPKIVINKPPGQKRTHSECLSTTVFKTDDHNNSVLNEEKASVSSPAWAEELQDGEVEIFIPNKKYKGKQGASPKPGFASFDQTKPPVAYVKKSVSKTPTPSSSAMKLRGKQSASGSAKKVSFDMKKNKSQAFKDSLKYPLTPYNPNKKPDQGILKTPDATTTPVTTPVMTLNPAGKKPPSKLVLTTTLTAPLVSTKPIKKATPMKRSKAKDFFYL